MLNSKNKNIRLKAFTLPELLIVLVIIGVLVLLALPRLAPLVSRAKSTEAQLQLKHIYELEKNYYYLKSEYSDNIEDIDFEQEKLVTDGGTANYLIEIVEASETSFKARATAVKDFDNDSKINIWEIDQDKNLVEIQKD